MRVFLDSLDSSRIFLQPFMGYEINNYEDLKKVLTDNLKTYIYTDDRKTVASEEGKSFMKYVVIKFSGTPFTIHYNKLLSDCKLLIGSNPDDFAWVLVCGERNSISAIMAAKNLRDLFSKMLCEKQLELQY